jgi:hypothetical protein
MRNTILFGLVTALCVVTLGIVMTGCEDAGGVNGIQVTPAAATLNATSGVSNTVVLTASVSGPLALPLTWSVSNPALGQIASSSGSNAVYIATRARGDNIVHVQDQYDAEGFATIQQQ